MHQPLILHSPDFQHYPTTPDHHQIWVGQLLSNFQALSSGLVPDLKALLRPFKKN